MIPHPIVINGLMNGVTYTSSAVTTNSPGNSAAVWATVETAHDPVGCALSLEKRPGQSGYIPSGLDPAIANHDDVAARQTSKSMPFTLGLPPNVPRILFHVAALAPMAAVMGRVNRPGFHGSLQ